MGGLEILVVLAIILLIFGPKQLPKLTKAAKESVEAFKEGKKADVNTAEETEK